MGWLYTPPEKHECETPRLDNDYSLAGARWECDDCETRWIYLPITWERSWVQLRWWHRFTSPMTGEVSDG